MPFDVNAALQSGYSMSQIADEMGAKSGFDVAAARQHGYSDDQIVSEISSHMGQSVPPAAPSFVNDLKAGLHGAVEGLGRTAQVIGQQTGIGPIANAGSWMVDNAPSLPAGYQSPQVTLGRDLKAGNWSALPSDIAHAGVNMAPDIGATLLAGVATDGPGAAVYQAARNAGDNAYARASNNGRAAPDTADVLESLPTTGLQAALGEIGIGGAAKGIANPVLRAGAQVGLEAGAGAAQDQVGQIGTSIGTQKGLQDDPWQSAGAALGAGAARLATVAPTVAADATGAALRPVTNRLMASRLEAPGSVEDAQSVIRVNNLADQVRNSASNASGQPLKDTQVFNNVKATLEQNLLGAIQKWKVQGLLAPDDVSDLRTLVSRQAARHNNTIDEGTDDVHSLFSAVDNLGLPADEVASFKNGVRDLNTVSTQSFIKNTTGPLQMLGTGVGKVAGFVGGLAHGNPLSIASDLIMGGGGGYFGGKIGGRIGALGDRAFGLNVPTAVLQAINAAKVLRAAGVAPDTSNPIGDLQAIRSQIPDILRSQRSSQTGADFADAAETDAQTLAKQSQQAQALRDQQINQAWAQKLAAEQAAAKAEKQRLSDIAKAEAAIQPPKVPSVDDYLSGQIDDPSLFQPSRPMTLSQEMALQSQRLANARALMRQGQQQQAVLDKAQADQIDNRAQAQVDRSAQRNAVSLQAATMAPTDRPDVPLEAQQAAVGGAIKAADMVRSLAASSGDAFDRVSIGLPPTDPIPVGSPVGADVGGPAAQTSPPTLPPLVISTPSDVAMAYRDDPSMQGQPAAAPYTREQYAQDLRQIVQRRQAAQAQATTPATEPAPVAKARIATKRPKAPQATPVAPPQAAPEAPPAAPAVAPATTPAAPPQQAPPASSLASPGPGPVGRPLWSSYVANGNPAVTHDVVMQALPEAVQRGLISPEEAQVLASHQGAYPGDRLRGLQQAALERLYGRPQGGGAGPAGPINYSGPMLDAQGRPIKALPAYNSAGTEYHANARHLAFLATSEGLPEIGRMVMAIAAEKPITSTSKLALAQKMLAELPDPDLQEKARNYMPTWLLSHGSTGKPQ